MRFNKIFLFGCVCLFSRFAMAYPICFGNAKILGFVPNLSSSGNYYSIGSNATFSGVSVSQSGCLTINESVTGTPSKTPTDPGVQEFVQNDMSQIHVDWSPYNMSSSNENQTIPSQLNFAISGSLWIELPGNVMASCDNVEFGQSVGNGLINWWMFANTNSANNVTPSLYCKTSQGGSSYILFYYSTQNGGNFYLQLK